MGVQKFLRGLLCLTGVMSISLVCTASQAADTSVAPAAGSITDMTVFQVKPGRIDDFMTVMRANIAHSRGEDGNVRFEVFRQPAPDAVTIYVLETWRDAEAIKVHAKQPTLIALHKAFAADLLKKPLSSAVETVSP